MSMRRSPVPNHPDYRGTRWHDVQVDLCTHLGLDHDMVETTIGEVLSVLDAAGYRIISPADAAQVATAADILAEEAAARFTARVVAREHALNERLRRYAIKYARHPLPVVEDIETIHDADGYPHL